MEMEVRKSFIDGEETKDIEMVVDFYASNKVALWERDILLVSPLRISMVVFCIWSKKPIQ